MRRALRVGALSFLVAASGGAVACAAPSALAEAQGTVSPVFVDALAPYGTWLQLPPYGLVWRPYPAVVGAGFVPYVTHGYWVATNVGWAWVSEWDWGWAPFHYGRWYLDPVYGWVWVPDTTWGPAWVDWRFGAGYVGWAPLPPGWTLGVGLGFFPGWCFVPVSVFPTDGFVVYRVPPPRARKVYAVTQPAPRVLRQGSAAWPAGPSPRAVEQQSEHPVPVVHVAPPPPGSVAAVPDLSGAGEVTARPVAPRAVVPPPEGAATPRAAPASPQAVSPPEVVAPPSEAPAQPSAAPPASPPAVVAPPSGSEPSAQPSAAPPAPPPAVAPPPRSEPSAQPSAAPPAPPPAAAPPASVTAAPPSAGSVAPPRPSEGHD